MDNLLLSLSSANIERYCQELARSQARPERRIAALDALLTFISTMTSPGEKVKAEFTAINEILLRHFEQARMEMMSSQRAVLAEALNAQHLNGIVTLYNALSREAFWQLLAQAVSTLDPSSVRHAAQWCNEWLAGVKTRSASVCPYPDSIDFKAAGVDVVEYAAMQDIHRYFTMSSTTGLDPGYL